MVALGAFKNCTKICAFGLKKKKIEKACGYSPVPIGYEQWSADDVS